MQLLSDVRAERLATLTVGDPGVQGAGITGVHAPGVLTPEAAAVAAMTVGFSSAVHIPNEGTLAIGLMSATVATGWLLELTRGVGRTTSLVVPGGTAFEHASVAPFTT